MTSPAGAPAAGVLPFASCPQCGATVVLLVMNARVAQDGRRHVYWTMPGGAPEAVDQDAPATAARELWEETGGGVTVRHGAVAGPASLAAHLRRGIASGSVLSCTVDSGRYVCFAAAVDFCEPLMIRLALSARQSALDSAIAASTLRTDDPVRPSSTNRGDGAGTREPATAAAETPAVSLASASPFAETLDVAWVHVEALARAMTSAGVMACDVPRETGASPAALIEMPAAAATAYRTPSVSVYIDGRRATLSAGTVRCLAAFPLSAVGAAAPAATASASAGGGSPAELARSPCAAAHAPGRRRGLQMPYHAQLGLGHDRAAAAETPAGSSAGGSHPAAASHGRHAVKAEDGMCGGGGEGQAASTSRGQASACPPTGGPAALQPQAGSDVASTARITGRKRGRRARRHLDEYERALLQMGADDGGLNEDL
jgi:8-oxo-dGTP pyrophosphatase MutT (NUDIX family)